MALIRQPFESDYPLGYASSPMLVDMAGTIRGNPLYDRTRSIGQTPEQETEMLKVNPAGETLSTLEIMRRRAALYQPHTMSPATRATIMGQIGQERARVEAVQAGERAKAEKAQAMADEIALAGGKARAVAEGQEPSQRRLAEFTQGQISERAEANRLAAQQRADKRMRFQENERIARQNWMESERKKRGEYPGSEEWDLVYSSALDKEITILEAKGEIENAQAMRDFRNEMLATAYEQKLRDRAAAQKTVITQKGQAFEASMIGVPLKEQAARRAEFMKQQEAEVPPVPTPPTPQSAKPPDLRQWLLERKAKTAESGGLPVRESADLDKSGDISPDERAYDEVTLTLEQFKDHPNMTPTKMEALKLKQKYLWNKIFGGQGASTGK